MPGESTPTRVQDRVDANGLITYYEALGAGEPLALLHGGFCTVETFAGLAPLLAERYRVIMPERRGHGRTPDVEGPITYELMAQDTIAFLDALGVSAAHLVGWSDGAMVALLMAMQRPDLARTLVMIGQPVNLNGIQPEMIGMLQMESMPDMLPPMLEETYAAVSPDGPEHWAVVKDKLWQMIRTEPTLELRELETVDIPTLLIVADHDFATLEHEQAMQQAFPDARLEVVPNATHGLPMEQPEVVSRLVLDFLETASSGD
jgi:pimeloyl-ACP methyl ester carboxylesterase